MNTLFLLFRRLLPRLRFASLGGLLLTALLLTVAPPAVAQSVDLLLRGGGTSDDIGQATATDAAGNVYVTGSFSGTATIGGTQVISAGGVDIFVVKYNASGVLQWVKRAGGSGNDEGNGIAVDASGVYVTGQFENTANFNTPSNPATNNLSSEGLTDIFVAKYNASGAVQWLRRAGGSDFDQGNGIAVDAGEVYVTGYFQGTTDFNTPSSPASNTLVSAGGYDIFVAKYNASGVLQWLRRAGGGSDDFGRGIAVDASGVYVIGDFWGTANFNTPASPASNTLTSVGSNDIFVAKYSTSGTVMWLRRAGGSGYDQGRGIAVDASGVYVTGEFLGTANFNTPSDPASNTLSSVGSQDIFVAKYNAAGVWQWARRGGAGSSDAGLGIAVDASGVYAAGYFNSTANFNTPSDPASNTLASAGGLDIFVAKYTTSGTVVWLRRGGGGGFNTGYGIALGASGVYVTGYFQNTANFNTPSNPASNTLVSAGSADLFLARFTLADPAPTLTGFDASPDPVCAGNVATFTATVGNVSGAYDFTLTNGTSTTTGTQSAATFSQPWTTAGSGTQSFTLRVVDNSSFTTATTTLTVNALPTAGINAPINTTVTCASPTITLTATGGSTYRWDNNTATASRTINASGTYSVTVTSASGCTAATSRSVTVTQNTTLPTVALSATNVCVGGAVSLSATAGLTSYTFLRGAGILVGTGTANTTIVAGLASGAYSFTVRGSNALGCTNTATASATVNALPTPTLTASNGGTLTCATTALTLTASGGTSYTFAGPGLAQTGNTPTAPVSQPGTYSLTARNATGCTATTTVTVSSNTAVVTVSSPATNTALAGVAFSQSFGATGGSGSYTFVLSSGSLPTGLTLTSSGVLSGTPTQTGTFNAVVQGRDANGCSDLSNPYALTVASTDITSLTVSPNAVCSGQSVTFQAVVTNVVGAYSFTLTNGTSTTIGSFTGSAFSQTWTTAGSGLQTFSLTVSDNNFPDVLTTTLTVNPLPSANINVPANTTLTCASPTLTLTATGGSTYRWDNTTNTASRTINASGAYAVTVTNGSGCTATISRTVTVTQGSTPPPLALWATSGCVGDEVSLSATAGLSSYTFVDSTGEIDNGVANTVTVAGLSSGSYSFSVLATGPNGCTNSATASATLSAFPTPTLTAGNGGTLTCAQTSLTLTATGGTSYTFSGPGVVASAGGSATINQPGTYSVIVANAAGCASTTTLTIDQGIDLPIPQLVASGTITCAGPWVTLTASDGAGLPGTSYAFAGPSGGPTGVVAQGGNSATVNAGGVYSVTITDTATGCFSTTTLTVVQNTTTPTLSVTPTSATLTCAQTSVTLTASGNATGYRWTGGATSNTLVVNVANTYSVTATAANGCTSTTSVIVSQSAGVPTAGLVASGTITCAQTSVTLTASGGNTYAFSGPAGAVASVGNSATVNADGLYSVTVTDTGTGCSSVTTVTVQSNTASPNVSIAPISGTLTCAVTSLTLTATSSATALRWTGGSTGATLPVSTSGTYSVTATGANGCSAVSNAVTITQDVAAPANASLTPSNSGTLTCAVTALTLTASATGGAGLPASLSYVFAGPTGALAGSGNTRTVSAPGLYSVTITGGNGCTASASTTVVSNTAGPTVSINPTSGTLTCAAPSLTLTATTSGTGLRWNTNQTTPTIVVSTSGTYSVTATAANGCTSTTNVMVNTDLGGSSPAPTLSASASVVCVGTNVIVVATVGGSPSGLQWYKDGQAVSGQTSATLALGGVQPAQAGSYVLVVAGVCSVTSTPFTLTVNPLPTVTLSFPTGTTVIGPGTGTATITLPDPLPAGFDLSFGAFGAVFYERTMVIDRINGYEIRSVDSSTGRFAITRPGPFTITATDANGCRQTVQGVITNLPVVGR